MAIIIIYVIVKLGLLKKKTCNPTNLIIHAGVKKFSDKEVCLSKYTKKFQNGQCTKDSQATSVWLAGMQLCNLMHIYIHVKHTKCTFI